MNMGPTPEDAERRAAKSYPDYRQIYSDFHRPSAGDFARFFGRVLIVGAVVVGVIYSLFAVLT